MYCSHLNRNFKISLFKSKKRQNNDVASKLKTFMIEKNNIPSAVWLTQGFLVKSSVSLLHPILYSRIFVLYFLLSIKKKGDMKKKIKNNIEKGFKDI